MKLVLIFGPQAVGKMTVGHELEKITGLKLFHNHMTIELVDPFFSYGSEVGKKLVNMFRKEIFEEVAKSDLGGMIFTYVWYFDSQEDGDYVRNVCEIFKKNGGVVYFVELTADLEERLRRNDTPHRLKHKPTKRDVKKSEENLLSSLSNHRLNSSVGEIKNKNYIKIDNTNLSAEETAKVIKSKFDL